MELVLPPQGAGTWLQTKVKACLISPVQMTNKHRRRFGEFSWVKLLLLSTESSNSAATQRPRAAASRRHLGVHHQTHQFITSLLFINNFNTSLI